MGIERCTPADQTGINQAASGEISRLIQLFISTRLGHLDLTRLSTVTNLLWLLAKDSAYQTVLRDATQNQIRPLVALLYLSRDRYTGDAYDRIHVALTLLRVLAERGDSERTAIVEVMEMGSEIHTVLGLSLANYDSPKEIIAAAELLHALAENAACRAYFIRAGLVRTLVNTLFNFRSCFAEEKHDPLCPEGIRVITTSLCRFLDITDPDQIQLVTDNPIGLSVAVASIQLCSPEANEKIAQNLHDNIQRSFLPDHITDVISQLIRLLNSKSKAIQEAANSLLTTLAKRKHIKGAQAVDKELAAVLKKTRISRSTLSTETGRLFLGLLFSSTPVAETAASLETPSPAHGGCGGDGAAAGPRI